MRKPLLCCALLALFLCVHAAAGETIRVVVQLHPYTDGIKALIPQFEKETGVKVQLEQYGEDQLFQKLSVEFTASGGSGIDVFATRPPQEGAMMAKNGTPTQIMAKITTHSDRSGLPSHAMRSPARPSFRRRSFTTPYSPLNDQRNSSPTTKAEKAQGRNTTA